MLVPLPPDRPVFIVAPHRSGTTVLYDVLSRHPRIGYLNRLAKRFPWSPWLAARAAPGTRWDEPVEAQRIWDHGAPRDSDVRLADDATDAEAARFRALLAATLRHRGADRFLAKYPRLPLRILGGSRVSATPGVRFTVHGLGRDRRRPGSPSRWRLDCPPEHETTVRRDRSWWRTGTNSSR